MKTLKEYKKFVELQKGIKVLVYFTEYIDFEGKVMLQGDSPKYGAWAHTYFDMNAESIVISIIIGVINDLACSWSKVPPEKVWKDKRNLKRNLDKLIAKGFTPNGW